MKLSRFLACLRRDPRSCRPSRELHGAHLVLETLENRTMPAVISGCVYYDVNDNGIRDAGELPIANSTIELHDSTGALVAVTTTDANGMYQFTNDPRIDT